MAVLFSTSLYVSHTVDDSLVAYLARDLIVLSSFYFLLNPNTFSLSNSYFLLLFFSAGFGMFAGSWQTHCLSNDLDSGV